MEIRHCKYCGAEITDPTALRCKNCGKELPKIKENYDNKEFSEKEIKEKPARQTLQHYIQYIKNNKHFAIIISVSIVILIIVIGIVIHSNYLNNRSTQDTADMGQTIVENDLGKDQAQLYYSKSSNTFTLKVITDSDLDNTISNNIENDESLSETEKFVNNYKQLIKDLYSHMGSKYKDYTVRLVNPDNAYRYLIDSNGKKITDNYLDY